ncbi:MAG: hypothetical protein V5A18_06380 [Haloarculaceae archaeon]
MRLLRETLRVTVVLLVASATLVAAGTVGLRADAGLLLVLAGLALGGFLGRTAMAEVHPRLGIPLGRYMAVVWLGPVVAAVIVLVAVGAMPAEVQALGGLVGLVAMANYFLRPVYYAILRAGRWLASV